MRSMVIFHCRFVFFFFLLPFQFHQISRPNKAYRLPSTADVCVCVQNVSVYVSFIKPILKIECLPDAVNTFVSFGYLQIRNYIEPILHFSSTRILSIGQFLKWKKKIRRQKTINIWWMWPRKGESQKKDPSMNDIALS